jgi:hypothetical protein
MNLDKIKYYKPGIIVSIIIATIMLTLAKLSKMGCLF